MIGGWPLFTQTLLDRPRSEEGEDRRGRRLPAELAYVEKGLAPVLLAQPTYLWGYVSVQRIFDKVHLKQDVPADHPDGAGAGDEGQPRHAGRASSRLGLHRRARGVPEAARSRWPSSLSIRSPVRFDGDHQALPRRRRARRRRRSRSPPARATRCAARTAPARARSARSSPASTRRTRAASLIDGQPVRFASPTRRARRRRRDGAPGARVLREPVGRREPLPRHAARDAAASSRSARCARRRRGDARVDRRRDRRRSGPSAI